LILDFMVSVLLAFHRYYTLRGNWHQEKGEKTVKFPEVFPCIPVTAWNCTTNLFVPAGWGLPWASKGKMGLQIYISVSNIPESIGFVSVFR